MSAININLNSNGFSSSPISNLASSSSSKDVDKENKRVSSSLSQRQILPIQLTPSLLYNPKPGDRIDVESTLIKTSQRILGIYLNACIERVTGCLLKRSRTTLQGSQSKKEKNLQSAHFSLKPSSQDQIAQKVKKDIQEKGLSPIKTGTYIQHRLMLSEQELQELQVQGSSSDVEKIFQEKLPEERKNSSLAGTTFERIQNATYENPVECNLFDSLLEKYSQSIIDQLDEAIVNGTITEQEYLSKFLQSYRIFIDKSVIENTKKISRLKEFSEIESKIITFEKKSSIDGKIELEDFKEYLENLKNFLDLKQTLTVSGTFSPKCSGILKRREDFDFLKRLVNQYKWISDIGDILKVYQSLITELKSPEKIQDIQELITPYEILLKEAEQQKKIVEEFLSCNHVQSLDKLLFGVKDTSGERRAPTAIEKEKQIFNLFKIATPIKKNTRKSPETPVEGKEAHSKKMKISHTQNPLAKKLFN